MVVYKDLCDLEDKLILDLEVSATEKGLNTFKVLIQNG